MTTTKRQLQDGDASEDVKNVEKMTSILMRTTSNSSA
jgi:hypothetical protein